LGVKIASTKVLGENKENSIVGMKAERRGGRGRNEKECGDLTYIGK